MSVPVPTPIDVLALSPQRTSTSELLADAARARGLAVQVVSHYARFGRLDPAPASAEALAFGKTQP